MLDLLAVDDNPRIAQTLYLSGKTVRKHVSTVVSKLGAADRADAAMRARRAGLGREDWWNSPAAVLPG